MRNDLENKAIASIYLGEHVEEVGEDVANWITEYLKKGISPKEFYQIWNDYIENGDSEKVPGLTQTSSGEKVYWLDVLELEDDLGDFYKKTVNEKAGRYITFNNNAYIDLVGIRGHPAPKDIASCVLGTENVGNWTDQETIECIGKEYLNEKD